MSTTGEKTIKNKNIWRLNNMLLNSQQITEEIKKKSKYAQKQNTKPMELSKKSAKGKVHSNTSLPQEIGENSNK